VGLRRFVAGGGAAVAVATRTKSALPTFKQYREADGRFYFKLVGADGRLLLQSEGFEQGRDAGQWVARLKQQGPAALAGLPAQRGEGIAEAELMDALAQLAAA